MPYQLFNNPVNAMQFMQNTDQILQTVPLGKKENCQFVVKTLVKKVSHQFQDDCGPWDRNDKKTYLVEVKSGKLLDKCRGVYYYKGTANSIPSDARVVSVCYSCFAHKEIKNYKRAVYRVDDLILFQYTGSCSVSTKPFVMNIAKAAEIILNSVPSDLVEVVADKSNTTVLVNNNGLLDDNDECYWEDKGRNCVPVCKESVNGVVMCKCKGTNSFNGEIITVYRRVFLSKCNGSYGKVSFTIGNVSLIQYIGKQPVSCPCSQLKTALKKIENELWKSDRKLYFENINIIDNITVIQRIRSRYSPFQSLSRNLADELQELRNSTGNGFIQHNFQKDIFDLPAFVLYDKDSLYDMLSLAIEYDLVDVDKTFDVSCYNITTISYMSPKLVL